MKKLLQNFMNGKKIKTSSILLLVLIFSGFFSHNFAFAQKYVWAKSMGSTVADLGSKSIAIDNTGNVYMAGSFQGTVDFDPGTGVANLVSAGMNDIFIAKYDSNGNYIWAKRIGGPGNDFVNEIIITSSGDLVITGGFHGINIDFDPGTGTALLSSAGLTDIFYAKYSNAGNYLFSRSFGSKSEDQGSSVKEYMGNIYLAGEFSDTIDFDPGTGTYYLISNGSAPDIFVAAFKSSGGFVFANYVSGTGNEHVSKLQIDSYGDIFLAGSFNGAPNFNPEGGTNGQIILTSNGAYDAFLMKYYSGGYMSWAKNFGGTGNDFANDLAIDYNHRLYLTGCFTSTANFGFDYSIYGTRYLTSNGDSDIFIASFSNYSDMYIAQSIGGAGSDVGTSIQVISPIGMLGSSAGIDDNKIGVGTSNQMGNTTPAVIVGGTFSGSKIDFNVGTDTNTLTSNTGSADIFVAKYDVDFNYMSAFKLGGPTNNDRLNDLKYLNDHLYLTGYFMGTNVDFNPRSGTAYLTATTPDMFLSKYYNTSPPSLDSLQTTSTDTSKLFLRAKITSLNGDTATIRGFICWQFDESTKKIGDPGVIVYTQNGIYGTGAYTGNFTGLSPGNSYSVRAYATNASGTGYSNVTTFHTLVPPPTSQATSFSVNYTPYGDGYYPYSSIDFNYAYTVGATGYIILQRYGAPPTSMPKGGVQYWNEDSVGDSKVIAKVDYYYDMYMYGYRNNVSYSYYPKCGSYFYKIIPFTWDGNWEETTNYLTTGTIKSDTAIVVLRPELKLNSPLYVSSTSFVPSATMDDGCSTVTERGFVYTDYPYNWTPDINNDNSVSKTGSFSSGTFKDSIYGLTPATQYLYAPYAINGIDINYGTPETLWTLNGDPPHHASYFTATPILSRHTIKLAFPSSTSQQCLGYIVIERTDAPPTGLPVDGVEYVEGDSIGNSKVARIIYDYYATSDSFMNVTSGHVYYYKLIPFNGYYPTTNYLTTPTIPLASAAMPLPPTLALSSIITNISSSGATVKGEITNTGAVNPTIRGICYHDTTMYPTVSDSVRFNTGSFGTGVYLINLTNLKPEKKYYYRSYAINIAGTGYSVASNSFWTNSTEPSAYPSTFTATTQTTTQIQLKFSAANTITNCDGYIIKMRQDSLPTGVPADGTAQTIGTSNGIEYVCAIITNPAATSTIIGNLNPGNRYYFKIYPFNWNGSIAETYNYRTQATVPTANAYAIIPPTLTTNQPATVNSSTSADINCNITNLGSDTNVVLRGICYMIYTASDPTTANTTNNEAGSFYTGTYTRSLTTLTAETHYKARAYANNIVGTGYGSSIDFWTFSTLPSAHAASFTATAFSTSQIDLGFSAASTITNADGYIVIMKQGSAPASLPTNGQSYQAGNAFGDASVVAIINSTTATTASITGLNPGNTYYFKLIPYNWDLTNSQTFNYRTLATIPGANAATIVAPAVTTSPIYANLSTTSNDISGEITSTNGASATIRGFCYKIYATGDPTTANMVTQSVGTYGTGIYTNTIGVLLAETRYKVRAFATNSGGTGYGATYDFYTYSVEPAAHAASFTATTFSTSQIDLGFSAASTITNADGYIVIMKQGSAPVSLPTNGQSYQAGNTFGDASVVAIINSTTATTASVTGLNPGNTYYFKLIPYNWDLTNSPTCIYRVQATIPGANATTIVPPTVTTNAVIANITNSSADISGEVTALNGAANVSTRGICYKVYAAGDPTTLNSTNPDLGTYTLGTYTRTLTGLTAETRYKARAYAISSGGTGYASMSNDFYTLSTEPSAHAASFTATTISTSQIDLSFSAASTITNTDGYMIIMNQGAAPTSTPVDGMAYSVGTVFGDATVVAIVNNTTSVSASITGLNPGNTYYFKLIPYNYDQTNTQTTNYRILATIPGANAATIMPPAVTTSAIIANISSTGADVSGEITALNGANATTRGICYKAYAAGDPTTANSTNPDVGTFSTGIYTRTLTGLSPETRYKFRAYAINSSGTGYGNLSYDFYTLSTEPSTHAVSFISNTISTSQIDLTFSAASTITNADGYIIIMNQGASPLTLPVDGQSYSTGSIFGDATVVAYINSTTTTSVSITGLNPGNTYYFKLIPFNWDQTNTQTTNFRTAATIPNTSASTIVPPYVSTSAVISNVSDTSADLSGDISALNGANITTRGICYKIFATGDPTTSNTVNSETGTFGLGTFSRTLTSLTAETRYKARAYAVNTAGTGYAATSTDFFTLSPEPAAHASYFTATTISLSQINLNFPAANTISKADGYIILMKQGTPTSSLPSDAISYVIGSPIGDATVCAIVNNSSTTSAVITSVNPGYTYYFELIPYNWNGINSATFNYLTKATIPLANATTIVPPSVVTSDIISGITDSAVSVGGDVSATGSSVVKTRGICYKIFSAGNPTIADSIIQDTGSFGTGSFIRNLKKLKPQTQYKIRAYASNLAGTGYGIAYDFYTLANEPISHAILFKATTSSTSQIDLDFSAAKNIPYADGYIIIQKQDAPPTGLPVDGRAYAIGSSIGTGTLAAIINDTTLTSASITSVSAGNNYYFTIIPFNWDGTNSQTFNYHTTGTIPVASASTITVPILTTISVDSINTYKADITGKITNTGGNKPGKRGICYKEYDAIDPLITDMKIQDSGTFNTGSFTFRLDTLTPETRYKVRSFATNTAGTGYGNSLDFFTFSKEPATHAIGFTAVSYSSSQIILTFEPANKINDADGYIIIQGQAVIPNGLPNDGSGYTSGNVRGNGTVAAIINDVNQASTTITNLNSGTKYYYILIPYNWNGNNTETYNYLTSGSIPQASATTLLPCSINGSLRIYGPSIVCQGDSVKLEVDYDTTLSYKWTRNNIVLPGATSSVYYAKTMGEYRVFITNGICSVVSSPYSLSNYPVEPPVIIASGKISPCSNDSISLTTSTYFDYSWSNGDSTQSTWVNTSGNYYVIVTDQYGCKVKSYDYTVNASAIEPPSICLVTIDSSSGKNLIVWERPETNVIDSYYVYKETTQAGKYQKIGALGYSELSVFLDTNSFPTVKADRYRLSILDTCGVESALGSPHKTMHLTINKGINDENNLIWDFYEGFTFGTYKILRGTTPGNMRAIALIQNNLTSYSDINPPQGLLFYQVVVQKPDACYPDVLRAQSNSGPYSQSVSNLKDYSNIGTDYLSAYPEEVYVAKEINSNTTITVYTNLTTWSAYTSSTWLDVVADISNKSVFINTNSENTDPNPRSCLLIIKSSSKDSLIINVFQRGTVGIDHQKAQDIDVSVYPNPYINSTNIEYELASPTHVNITVYDMYGHPVSRLMNETQKTGKHLIKYSAQESGLAEGIYYMIFDAEGKRTIKKLIEMH